MQTDFVWVVGLTILIVLGWSIWVGRLVRVVSLLGTVVMTSAAVNTNVPNELSNLGLNFVFIYVAIGLAFTSRKRDKIAAPIGAVVFYGLLTLSTLLFNSDGLPALLKLGVLAVGTAVVASGLGVEDWHALQRGVVWIAIAHTIACVWEVVAGAPVIWPYAVTESGSPLRLENPLLPGMLYRAQSTLGHPIPAAYLFGVAAVFLGQHNLGYRAPVRLALFTLLGFGILLTGSRSVLIAAGIALLILFLSSVHGAHKRILRSIIVLAATTLIVVFDPGISEAIDQFMRTGSFTNRLGALESLPGLLSRSPIGVLLGSGWGSEPVLFDDGYLQQNGFGVVDNQLVTIIAVGGLLACATLLGYMLAGVKRAQMRERPALVYLIIMMLSFDYLRWPCMLAIFFIVFSNGNVRRQAGTGGGSLPGHFEANTGSSSPGSAVAR